MKKKYRRIVALVLVFAFALSSVATAASVNEYFDEETANELFSPNSGTFNASYYSDEVRTTLYFEYSEERVEAIWQYVLYNSVYAGVDVKCDPSWELGDTMDAYSVSTNLPNPKTDTEGGETIYDHESEAVAQDKLTANKTYTMTTRWHDYRSTTDTGETGRWTVNAEHSVRIIADYNTLEYDSLCQVPFNSVKGEP